jgi:tetratricopeptide (TPR) repeat protein
MSKGGGSRTVFEQMIRRRRFTFQEFVDDLKIFAREHGEVGTLGLRHVQRLAVGEWPAEKVKPATVRLLEHYFGHPIEELLAAPERVVPELVAPEPLTAGSAGAAPLLEAVRALPGDEQEAERMASIALGENRTDAAALESVAAVLSRLRRLEDVTSAAAVLPTVAQQQSLVTAMAANSPTTGIRKKAVGLLSEIHQYAGWLNMPGKNFRRAQQNLDRASILALEVGDAERLSLALSFLSYKSLRCDEVESAVALNEAASRDRKTQIGLRTYLTFQRAEILARSGNRSRALTVLVKADKMTADLPPEDELPDSGYWYTTGFFHGQRAFVLNSLGDRTQAKRVAAEALAMLPESWRVSEWAQRRRLLAELG